MARRNHNRQRNKYHSESQRIAKIHQGHIKSTGRLPLASNFCEKHGSKRGISWSPQETTHKSRAKAAVSTSSRRERPEAMVNFCLTPVTSLVFKNDINKNSKNYCISIWPIYSLYKLAINRSTYLRHSWAKYW